MICNTIGLTADSFESIYTTGGTEVEEVYGAIDYAQPIYAKIREMTGTSPLAFTSRVAGTLTDYWIFGETIQDGTPSPDMPVDVVGVGEKTENLFDKDNVSENYYLSNGVPIISFTRGGYVLSDYIPIASSTATISSKINASLPYGSHWAVYDENKTFIRGGTAFIASSGVNVNVVDTSGAAFIRVDYATNSLTDCMLNLGSTALPYVPYGYKLPLTVTDGTDTVTTPVYIGAEPLHRIGEYADYVDYATGKIVRKIKKLVLTGEEACYSYDFQDKKGAFVFGALDSEYTRDNGFCSHYPVYPSGGLTSLWIGVSNKNLYFVSIFDVLGISTIDDFKSYLAAQYAAGTPVTVWYVLATPIEEDPPVPFPALTTLSGTNTMSIDTTVKPSQMYIKGKIKPDGYGELVDSQNVSINDSTGEPINVHGQF